MRPFVKAVDGMHHSVIYTDTDGRHFRFSNGTWAWRNHNPGNLRPGEVSARHNQIGSTHDFAIFPDDKSGHEALLDSLHTTHGKESIHDMIYSFAPPKDHNNTAQYEKMLRKMTGVYDDTPINDFTPLQFEHLWQGIQKYEEYKIGDVIEVHCITAVKKAGKSWHQFCLDNTKWVTHDDCVELTKRKMVELELCTSINGNQFLRSPPNSLFQKPLGGLPCKKD